MTCIKLCAKNDCNGNPRRVYVLFDSEGNVVRARDEGFIGRSAVAGLIDKSAPIPEFDTTPTEYRRLLRLYGN
jgi:hypothetical protein